MRARFIPPTCRVPPMLSTDRHPGLVLHPSLASYGHRETAFASSRQGELFGGNLVCRLYFLVCGGLIFVGTLCCGDLYMPEPARLTSAFQNVTSTVGLPASATPLSTFDKELERSLENALRDLRDIESGLRTLQSQYKQMSAGAQSQLQQLNRNNALLSLTVSLDIVRVFASDAKSTISRGNIPNSFSGVTFIDYRLRQLKVDLDAAQARLESKRSWLGSTVQQVSSSKTVKNSVSKFIKP
jgi:hypothetical protein